MESSTNLTGVAVTAALALAALACLLSAYLIYKVRQIHVTIYGTDAIARTLSHSVTQNLQRLELLRHTLRLSEPLPVLRYWAASPDVLLLIADHVRRTRPAVIVECGSGASTVALALAARLNGRGHVYAVDHDGDYVAHSRDLLARYALSHWATVVHAPLRDQVLGDERWEWYDVAALSVIPQIDLLFVDGPPADPTRPLARYPAGPTLFPRLAPTGTVFVDDTDRPGEREILRRWALAFPDLERRDHGCEKGCSELRRNVDSGTSE